ncbi:MAG: class I SAM-dependent methyltransferase [Oceanicoccus sp.]
MIPGIQGYAEQADELIKRYEAVSFEEKHQPELRILPVSPALILDVGAGTGADAAWFASKGHSVVAVEPTDELREPGKSLHPSPVIEWVKDSLPDLALVLARNQQFGAVMLTAVWMHLDQKERMIGMPNLNALLAPGGVLVITLRHGPVPDGRRMFDVRGDETIALAKASDLQLIHCTHTESIQDFNRAQHVTWTHLAFRRPT